MTLDPDNVVRVVAEWNDKLDHVLTAKNVMIVDMTREIVRLRATLRRTVR